MDPDFVELLARLRAGAQQPQAEDEPVADPEFMRALEDMEEWAAVSQAADESGVPDSEFIRHLEELDAAPRYRCLRCGHEW